jgi:diguanylate cyclase (GGDEF)-like protein
LRRDARWFTAIVSALGLAVFLLVVGTARVHDRTGLGLFAAFILLAELFPVRVPGGTVSIALGLVYPTYLLFGPGGAAVAMVSGVVTANLVRRRPAGVVLFNGGQYALAVAAASGLVAALRRTPFDVAPGLFHPWTLVFIPSFIAVNHLLVDIDYALEAGIPLRRVWWEPLRVEGLWILLSIPLGLLLVLAYTRYGPLLAVVLYGPVFATSYVARLQSTIADRNREMASLLDLSQRLSHTLERREILDLIEEEASRFLGGRVEVHAGQREEDRRPTLAPQVAAELPALLADRGTVVGKGDAVRQKLPAPYRSFAATVVNGPEGRVGTLFALFTREEPEREAVRYLEAVAGHAALALESAALYQETRRLAITDAMLPELFNYRHLIREIERAVADAAASGEPLALLYMDLDGFKKVNDRYGHLAGDELLRRVVRAILASARSGDVPFRYAGDEFVLLLRKTDEATARQVADRIEAAVAAALGGPAAEFGVPLGISVGVAAYRPGEAWQAFLHRADEAMYAVKSRRRRATS